METRDAPKLKRVKRLDSIRLDKNDSTYFTDEGYLVDHPILTSCGIFEYTNPDGSIRRELRLPKYVFDEKSLKTYRGKPIIITHEAGHAFAAYLNRNRVPYECIWPSLEACEVHSMSMEFFAEAFSEEFFGEDAGKYNYSHLADALCFIPYGTMVDHFQHIVYENPNLSPAERHAKWKELVQIYQPWFKLDGEIPFYSEGEGWQRQHHIYSSPFYYIDYCLAQTVALQFWNLIQKDQKEAWQHYMAYTKQGGSVVFTKLLKNAGLESPFQESCLRGICDTAAKYLSDYDLSGIA